MYCIMGCAVSRDDKKMYIYYKGYGENLYASPAGKALDPVSRV